VVQNKNTCRFYVSEFGAGAFFVCSGLGEDQNTHISIFLIRFGLGGIEEQNSARSKLRLSLVICIGVSDS
jgi:hypothetical protein